METSDTTVPNKAVSAIDPFIHNSRYLFVFCRICWWALVTNESTTYLAKHHTYITLATRRGVLEALWIIVGLLDTKEDLVDYQLPDRQLPIPYIHPLATDGLRCNICPYVVRIVKGM